MTRPNQDVILTCAVTGAGDTTGKNPHVPFTPAQIAASCVGAARAGAAVVHVHVRDPVTGKAGRDLDCYREVVERVRDSGTDVILNLTCGMGGELHLDPDDPSKLLEQTDLVCAYERMRHVEELRPEICTIDCGSMNFGNHLVVNRNSDLERMASYAGSWGVKPELEVFDMGQTGLALRLVQKGLVPGDPLFQFCLGIPGGAPATAQSILALKAMLPDNAIWAAFGIGQLEMPMVAQALLLGGNIRVGLEDNLYLEKGVLATNESLVEKARRIVEDLGSRLLTPRQARQKLKLQ
ncbi:MAG: 3-keto-5-aminohexanoate cleavage protein [Gammaproteobacteria bacterium]|nr:3-keto-5-aminohexanoate cleavage protein [Gammaproteobacteria bacterium]